MKFLTTAALLAAASPALAGPLDTLQYRATLRTDRPTTTGPAFRPGETAYLLGGPPDFGVVVGNSSEWTPASPAYPGAGFAILGASGLTPFTAVESVGDLEVGGGGSYDLDLEFRDDAGRVATVSLSGSFAAGWWGGHGYAYPVYVPPDHSGGDPGGPPWGSFWLGPTRYAVQIGYGAVRTTARAPRGSGRRSGTRRTRCRSGRAATGRRGAGASSSP